MRPFRLAARAFAAGSVVACVAPAIAKTVKLPEQAPQVLFDVPDDWTVTAVPMGVEVAPPDKSAMFVAGLIARERSALTRWQKDATKRMEEFGVAFDPKAKKPGAPPKATAPSTLFSGAPVIGTPEHGPQSATAFEDKANAGLPLEDLTGRAPPKGAKIPYNGLVIYGASYVGTPVDAEFLNFALSPKELFLMQQESGSTDERIGAVVESVRRP